MNSSKMYRMLLLVWPQTPRPVNSKNWNLSSWSRAVGLLVLIDLKHEQVFLLPFLRLLHTLAFQVPKSETIEQVFEITPCLARVIHFLFGHLDDLVFFNYSHISLIMYLMWKRQNVLLVFFRNYCASVMKNLITLTSSKSRHVLFTYSLAFIEFRSWNIGI